MVSLLFLPNGVLRASKETCLVCIFENIWSWYMQCFVLGHRLCDEPPPLENGYILGNDFREGKNITYKCNKGYWLRGPPVRICDGETGNWTVEAPICEGITNPQKSCIYNLVCY